MKLQDIRIYNKDLELVAIIPKFIAANWEIKFSEYGTGEIELEKTDEILTLLYQNEYLFLVQGDIQSIITGYKVGKTCVIFTRTLEWLLTKFVVTKVEKSANLSELVMNFLSVLPEEFNITYNGLEDDITDMSEYSFSRATDVYSAIKEAIPDLKTGFSLKADFKNKSFEFSLKNAVLNQDILLCDEYKTSYDSEYTYDIQKVAKGGYYYHDVTNMGKWDPQNNEPQFVVNAESLGHYYIASSDGYALGKDITKGDILILTDVSEGFKVVDEAKPFLVRIPTDSNGIFAWSEVLDAQNSTEADAEIKSKKPIDLLTMKTRLNYGTDYNLGDIIQTKFYGKSAAVSKKKLVFEVHLWVEREDLGARPTMIDILEEEKDVI